MVKYWFLSGQGLPARARSFVGVMQDTLCPGPNQSFWQEAPKRKRKKKKKIRAGEATTADTSTIRTCRPAKQRERERQECRYLQHRLQLIWILMMCLLSGNARQITADGITVGVPWAGNEDLGERVYILFKRLSAGAEERDSGNVLCYNSVVVPPSRSDNRLANGKPSITISLLFHRCLRSPQLCTSELE